MTAKRGRVWANQRTALAYKPQKARPIIRSWNRFVTATMIERAER